MIEYDPNKDSANIAKHGVSLARVAYFEFETALIAVDGRVEYGETRHSALGYIEGRLHRLVYTVRGNNIRAISLRKANHREIGRYAKA